MTYQELVNKINDLKSDFKVVNMKEIPLGKKNFLKTKKYQCILENEAIFNREEVLKNGRVGHAVVIVPVTTDLKTVLIVEPRVLTEEAIGVEVPAGYVEENELREDAAIRELREETGYVPKDLIHLIDYYQDQGCSRAKISCYLATGCEKLYQQNLDKDEHIKFLECDYEQALQLIDDGIINDANSIIALTKSQKYISN